MAIYRIQYSNNSVQVQSHITGSIRSSEAVTQSRVGSSVTRV